MKIQALEVSNFRAISELRLTELPDVVVIAGPNGCGKSCTFDAIRLLKSIYGGYQPNELQNWFGEFQIAIGGRQEDLLALFQNRTRSLRVKAELGLSEIEREYLTQNADALIRESVWKAVVPELATWRYIGATPLASHLRAHSAQVEGQTAEELPLFQAELARESFVGELVIEPNGTITTTPSRVLELVFSLYLPQQIGVIDYHGPQRNYAREQVGGINLNIESSEQQRRQHALYNYGNKYTNVKSEMASGFVRDLLAEAVGGRASVGESLTATLKELFATFFPSKEFLGPQPTADGRLLFPVRTPAGTTHDIDELSSGEKEVLYGYLRLRNTAPRNSVLRIDEPELHLNPRLIQGLPQFYHEHLGKALGNQLWLVTHSDAILRQAVGRPGFRVFHMQPPGLTGTTNQVREILVAEELERLVVDLVGDLAAYRPGAKLVVFEGGGDSEFDLRMAGLLFPEFVAHVNTIAGGNKQRVGELHSLLERAREVGQLPLQFFAIVDKDSDEAGSESEYVLQWDVYHIENYLLVPHSILRVLKELNSSDDLVQDEAGVLTRLKYCAEQTLPTLVRHQLQLLTNKELIACVRTGIDPKSVDQVVALHEALESSAQRMSEAVTRLSPDHLRGLETNLKRQRQDELNSGQWLERFRGRDILKRFVGLHGGGLKYEQFRDLVLARMHDEGYQPRGMKAVFDQISAVSWPSPSRLITADVA
jgi:predicted ATPase